MIRLFSKLCKCFKAKNSINELEIFNTYMKSIDVDSIVCPFCGAKHTLSPFATYTRHLVTYTDSVSDNIISISRYSCSSCGHTHSALPPMIIPYMSFSFNFTIFLLYNYFSHTFPSTETLCFNFKISISNFYLILKKFKEHKRLWLGLMDDFLKSNCQFAQEIYSYSLKEKETLILAFFSKTSFSFFEGNVRLGLTWILVTFKFNLPHDIAMVFDILLWYLCFEVN